MTMWWTAKGLTGDWCAAAECLYIVHESDTRVRAWLDVPGSIPLPSGWRLTRESTSPTGCRVVVLDYIEGYNG